MTTIGIVGMGKMGQTIATLLESRQDLKGHLFHRISTENISLLKSCDVVIEFTTPEAAPGVIRQCLDLGLPLVSGTTGWHEYHLESILTFCKQHQSKFLYATNFSIGMNITFALNKKLADVMERLPSFKPAIKEIHHIHKKDMPSGTAYTLIEGIIKNHSGYSGYTLNAEANQAGQKSIPVKALREGEVKGYHEVLWNSGAEQIILAHEAFDRRIFAEGAVMAAGWLAQQSKGVYTMSDMLEL